MTPIISAQLDRLIEVLEEHFEHQDYEIERLKHELDRYMQTDSLLPRASLDQLRIDDLQTENNDLRNVAARATAELADTHRTIDRVAQARADIANELRDVRQELADLKVTAARDANEVVRLTAENERFRGNIVRLNAEAAGLREHGLHMAAVITNLISTTQPKEPMDD